jgi:hypothetical protein
LKSNRDLFIVSAPFQLLSAIEAKHFFKTENSTIIYTKELENSLDISNWNEKIQFPENSKSNFKKSLKFVKRFQNREFRYIFVGNYFSSIRSHLQKILASNLNAKKVIFLDDGVLTTLQNFETNFQRKVPFSKLLKWKIFGYKTNLQDFSIFTVLKTEQRENLEIFENNFSFFKNLANENFIEKSDNFYFIGSAKMETWQMGEKNFINLMKKVFSFAERFENIYFVPHRHCSTKSIEIVKKLGFKVLKFSKPIEFEFLERKEKPLNIASTTSTALLSLKVIFEPKNVYSFQIGENEIREDRVIGMKSLYKTFENFGVDLI